MNAGGNDMDKTSLIGVILGVIAVGVGMILKGVPVSALLNPAAFLIIFLGTAAAVVAAFPTKVIKNIPALFKVIFKETQDYDINELIYRFTKWAELTRKEGLLALEKEMEQIEDPFLASGIQMATDGQTSDFIRDVLQEKIGAMEERHEEGARVFSQAGTYAPSLGVLGAVVGLIAALGNMEDMDVLGAAISAAFVATVFGIYTGSVLWHPFTNKLKERCREEVKIKEVMVEGVLSITAGESPTVIQDKLSYFLSTKEIEQLKEYMESQVEGNVKEESTEEA